MEQNIWEGKRNDEVNACQEPQDKGTGSLFRDWQCHHQHFSLSSKLKVVPLEIPMALTSQDPSPGSKGAAAATRSPPRHTLLPTTGAPRAWGSCC